VTGATRDDVRYELTLFVSGASDLSARAIANAKELCDTHLDGRYELSVVDVHEDAAAALNSDVIAAPTLVRTWPLPVRKLVGDLSRTDKVLVALDLAALDDAPAVVA
jgi:circadian clock protein KaiB